MDQMKFYIKTIDGNLLNCVTGLNGKLISMLKSGKYDEDESLLSRDFAKEKGHQYYLNTKQRTLKILQSLFMVNPPMNRKETSEEKWVCRRKYNAGLGLLDVGKRELAWKPLIQAFRIATESSYTEIAYGAAHKLMTSCGLNRKQKDFDHYRNQAYKYYKDLEAELKIDEIYYRQALVFNSNKEIPYNELYNDLEELNSYKCDSIHFLFSYYYLRIIIDLQLGRYALAKLSAEGAIQTLKGRRGLTGTALQIFYRNKAVAQIALKEHQAASKSLKKSEEHCVEKSFNWHVIQYTKAINYLHSKNYKKAHQLYREYRKNKFAVVEEYWLVIGAYLYFLREIGAFKAPFERFKVGRYLNETSVVHHDKKGANVNILIGELLIYMVTNRSKFIERVNSINQYSYRYLKDENSKRAKWFIRLLCKVPQADFNFPKLLKKADQYIERLNEHPVGLGDNLTTEIIPYDHIIEIMRDSKVLQMVTE